MDILNEFMGQIENLKAQAEQVRLSKIQKAEQIFMSAKEELITKIDPLTYADGQVILRKAFELPDGLESVDYEHLTELCHENCINVDWSEHMGVSARMFIFKLDLRKVELVVKERQEQAKLELK